MKKKFAMIVFLVSLFVLSGMAVDSYAFFGHAEKKGHGMDFEDKFFGKIHLIFTEESELGISDEQMKNVKELKMKTEKDLIKKNAEIDVIAVDISAEMQKDPIDINAVTKLIDKKYELKKEKAKGLVEACVALNGLLTKEQKEKMKSLCKKDMKEASMMKCKMRCPMMKGKM